MLDYERKKKYPVKKTNEKRLKKGWKDKKIKINHGYNVFIMLNIVAFSANQQ